MHIKELNLFLPATDDWLKFFTANAQVLAGELVDKSVSQAYPVPDITRAAITPLKQAAHLLNKYNKKLNIEYQKYKDYYSNIDYGTNLIKCLKQAYSKVAKSVGALSKIFTKKAGLGRLPEPHSLSNSPNVIDLIYSKDVMLAADLAVEILSNPLKSYYADRFYKASKAWQFLKKAVKGDPSGLMFLRGGHVSTNIKPPVENASDEEDEEGAPPPKRKPRKRRR
jgi:hypothetical protein